MQEQQNTSKVQEMYAAFGRGDIKAILNQIDDDCVWEAEGSANTPTAGRYCGRAGVADFFKRVAATWEMEAFEPREYIAQGDNVIALGHYRWRARVTGRIAESDWAMLFTLRNGKLVRFREYTDTLVFDTAFRE